MLAMLQLEDVSIRISRKVKKSETSFNTMNFELYKILKALCLRNRRD